MDLLDKMPLDGLHPGAVSFLAAFCACNLADLVEEGVKLFDSMWGK